MTQMSHVRLKLTSTRPQKVLALIPSQILLSVLRLPFDLKLRFLALPLVWNAQSASLANDGLVGHDVCSNTLIRFRAVKFRRRVTTFLLAALIVVVVNGPRTAAF